MHLGLRASRRFHRRAGRAALGLRALDHRATRSRAGRAIADLARLVARADTRRAGGHRRLENVATHVRRSGALCLEHVAAQIGLRRARRDRGLQDILRPIDLGALVALGFRVT